MQDRNDPKFWDEMRQAWWKHARVPLNQYTKYSRWFRGEFTETGDVTVRGTKLPKDWRGALVNLTNLVTRTSRADLFYRNPRFLARPSGSLNQALFTPELAHTESILLNALATETGLYRQGRRALLDGLLGPFMVLKVGYSADIGLDMELVDSERDAADAENQNFVANGVYPKLQANDLHSVHIEQHQQVIAAVERGDIKLPSKLVKYMKKHIQKHQESAPHERPKETVRNDSIFVRRRSPLNVFFDPWAEDSSEREWMGERYIARIEDVQNNKDFSSSERKNIQSLTTRWNHENHLPAFSSDTITTPDQYCMLYEVIDMVNNKVITYAQGGAKPLLVKDYTLSSILPSGPYVDASFMEDPFEGFGIAPPAVYEAHQIAATYLAAVNTKTVQRSSPKLGYNAQYIGKEELSDLKKFLVAGLVPFKSLAPGMKISDVMHQIPPCAVPDQNMTLEAYHRRMIEQFSGMGSAKLGGGDTSRTATASAIIGESVTTLSEDLAAVVDDWMARTGKTMLRLARRFYTQARVAELVGEDALKSWPMEWADRDIANDRGVIVVPGSSRRNNSSVEQKLLQDVYALVSQDPTTPVPMKMELLQRLLESMGIFGIDYSGAQEAALLAKLQEQIMAQAQMQPPEAGGPAPRRSEASEPSRAGQAQGVANVGGGRLSTGASKGDKPRTNR